MGTFGNLSTHLWERRLAVRVLLSIYIIPVDMPLGAIAVGFRALLTRVPQMLHFLRRQASCLQGAICLRIISDQSND
jgi:hypothetical protein